MPKTKKRTANSKMPKGFRKHLAIIGGKNTGKSIGYDSVKLSNTPEAKGQS